LAVAIELLLSKQPPQGSYQRPSVAISTSIRRQFQIGSKVIVASSIASSARSSSV
jgi:hypothetical protein